MTPPEPQLVTVGYQGRTSDELVDELVDLGVSVLIDVRLTPLSRKPGLSKRRLAAALQARGITYVHLPQLGNPKDNRESLRAGETKARARFQARMRSRPGGDAIQHIAGLATRTKVALLCFERDARTCHRQLVSDEAVRVRPDLAVLHAA